MIIITGIDPHIKVDLDGHTQMVTEVVQVTILEVVRDIILDPAPVTILEAVRDIVLEVARITILDITQEMGGINLN
jgi:hypothetical protein